MAPAQKPKNTPRQLDSQQILHPDPAVPRSCAAAQGTGDARFAAKVCITTTGKVYQVNVLSRSRRRRCHRQRHRAVVVQGAAGFGVFSSPTSSTTSSTNLLFRFLSSSSLLSTGGAVAKQVFWCAVTRCSVLEVMKSLVYITTRSTAPTRSRRSRRCARPHNLRHQDDGDGLSCEAQQNVDWSPIPVHLPDVASTSGQDPLLELASRITSPIHYIQRDRHRA